MDELRIAALIIDLLAECRDHNDCGDHVTPSALFLRGASVVKQLIELSDSGTKSLKENDR